LLFELLGISDFEPLLHPDKIDINAMAISFSFIIIIFGARSI
jgi:hypothetical protein